jgi:hypothetical protein
MKFRHHGERSFVGDFITTKSAYGWRTADGTSTREPPTFMNPAL